jgi:hypothetical protein
MIAIYVIRGIILCSVPSEQKRNAIIEPSITFYDKIMQRKPRNPAVSHSFPEKGATAHTYEEAPVRRNSTDSYASSSVLRDTSPPFATMYLS